MLLIGVVVGAALGAAGAWFLCRPGPGSPPRSRPGGRRRLGDGPGRRRRACAPSGPGCWSGSTSWPSSTTGPSERLRRAESEAAAARGGAAQRAGGGRAARGAARPPRRRAEAGVPGAVGRRAGPQQRAVRRARRGPDQGGGGGAARPRPTATPRPARTRSAQLLDPMAVHAAAGRGPAAHRREGTGVGLRRAARAGQRDALQLGAAARTRRSSWSTRCGRRRSAGGGASCSWSAIVQLAGMVEHCDFSTQVTGQGEDGGVRPDMVVRLAGDKQIVVDAKVPFAAYLEAVESRDPDVHTERLAAHARQLRQHVDTLSCQELLGGVPAVAGVRGAVRARRPVPGGGPAGRSGAAGARLRAQRRDRHADHADRAAAHRRLQLAAGGAGPQRRAGAPAGQGAARPAGHDGHARGQARPQPRRRR